MGVEIVTKDDLDAIQQQFRADLGKVIEGQREILHCQEQLKKRVASSGAVQSGYIPALEYMRAVGIKRWKFNQLIVENKIRT